MTRPRLLIVGGAVIVVALLLVAWALAGDSPAQGVREAERARYSTALGAPNEPDSVVTSRAVFAHSPSAILVRDDAPAEVVARSAEAARSRHVPLLTVGPTSVAPVRAELTRLGVGTVLTRGEMLKLALMLNLMRLQLTNFNLGSDPLSPSGPAGTSGFWAQSQIVVKPMHVAADISPTTIITAAMAGRGER